MNNKSGRCIIERAIGNAQKPAPLLIADLYLAIFFGVLKYIGYLAETFAKSSAAMPKGIFDTLERCLLLFFFKQKAVEPKVEIIGIVLGKGKGGSGVFF